MNRLCQQLGEVGGALFANWLASIFYLLFPMLYDIRWHGLENYRASPSTLITINHKRDSDLMIVAPALHIRRTLLRNKQRLYFVARDDIFEPGFLTSHFLIKWPLGKLVHRINIALAMRALRAGPISLLIHKRVRPLMQDVIRSEGDIRLSEVVKRTYLEDFADRVNLLSASELADISVSDFLSYDYRVLHDEVTDVGILKEGLARKVRTQSLKRIEQQLKVFANILDDGGICLLAPEGDLSPDGRFWPVKSGLYRLLSMTRTDVTILPVNTTYDFMTQKRMRVYVDVGKEILLPKSLTKMELERRVQKDIVSLGRVTMGQLGSDYLLQKLESGKSGYSEMLEKSNENLFKDSKWRI
jgi:1-acyl-sn-glycerol-3-phosphate acyltransferase